MLVPPELQPQKAPRAAKRSTCAVTGLPARCALTLPLLNSYSSHARRTSRPALGQASAQQPAAGRCPGLCHAVQLVSWLWVVMCAVSTVLQQGWQPMHHPGSSFGFQASRNAVHCQLPAPPASGPAGSAVQWHLVHLPCSRPALVVTL